MTRGERPVTVIEPRRGWAPLDPRELWRYRELLWVLARRDVQVRYKQTVLGVAWAVLQPVLRVLVFTLIFVGVMRSSTGGVPGPVFMYTGQLPWLLFSTAVSAMSVSLIGSSGLVTKVYFPRLVLPLSAIGAPLVDALISFVVLLAPMLVSGVVPAWTSLPWIVPALVALLLLAVGCGVFLAAFTVTYRDFRHVTPFLLSLLMFLTPVVWPVERVPEAWRLLLRLNPLTGVVTTFRAAFLGTPVDLLALGISLGTGLVLAFVASVLFARFERRFADVI